MRVAAWDDEGDGDSTVVGTRVAVETDSVSEFSNATTGALFVFVLVAVIALVEEMIPGTVVADIAVTTLSFLTDAVCLLCALRVK